MEHIYFVSAPQLSRIFVQPRKAMPPTLVLIHPIAIDHELKTHEAGLHSCSKHTGKVLLKYKIIVFNSASAKPAKIPADR